MNNVLKLSLYQDTRFITTCDSTAFFDPVKSLKALKAMTGPLASELPDEEIVIISSLDAVLSGSCSPSTIIGTGPIEQEQTLKDLGSFTLKKGVYSFYQFTGDSKDDILSAVQYSLSVVRNRGYSRADEDTIILRGIKEAGFYVFQILFPLND